MYFSKKKKKTVNRKTDVALKNLGSLLFIRNQDKYISIKNFGYSFVLPEHDMAAAFFKVLAENTFILLECRINFEKKKISFIKFRKDKFVANSVQTILSMNSNK